MKNNNLMMMLHPSVGELITNYEVYVYTDNFNVNKIRFYPSHNGYIYMSRIHDVGLLNFNIVHEHIHIQPTRKCSTRVEQNIKEAELSLQYMKDHDVEYHYCIDYIKAWLLNSLSIVGGEFRYLLDDKLHNNYPLLLELGILDEISFSKDDFDEEVKFKYRFDEDCSYNEKIATCTKAYVHARRKQLMSKYHNINLSEIFSVG